MRWTTMPIIQIGRFDGQHPEPRFKICETKAGREFPDYVTEPKGSGIVRALTKKDTRIVMRGGAPKISVGMPVFNGEPYIEIAIQSILDQTFGDFELLISDNASTDQTETICRDFAASDKRIRFMRNERNIGAAQNYNRLVDLASAPYFRWSNADDVLAPTLHERCIDVLDTHPDVVLSYGKTKLIDEDGSITGDYDDNLNLQDERPSERFQNFHDSVGLTNIIYGLIRTSAVLNSARMGDGSYPAADTNLMGELVLYGKFAEISEPLFFRRLHSASSSGVESGDRADVDRQTSFWSAGAVGFSRPVWRKNVAYVRAILRAPVTAEEKRRLGYYMLRRSYASKRELLMELVSAASRKTGLG